MINTPTLLILGAGASVPFRFPSGAALYAEIISELRKEDSPRTAELRALGLSPGGIVRFAKTLRLSGLNSVDAFLERRPTFMDVGKAAIAQALIPYERTDKLFPLDEDRSNWYKYLFQRMNTSFEDFGQNRVSVLTYNYDRSLEHFLFTALKSISEDKSNQECAEKLSEIPIIHLHGRLGRLPWQPESGAEQPLLYDADATPEQLRVSAESIKIIHEDIGEYPESVRVKQLLDEAERVYFLGFGYHHKNVQRLNLQEVDQPKQMQGTTVGFTGREVQELKVRLENKVELCNPGSDILGFFRNNVRLG